jgi:hypothetical protein
MYVHPTNLPLPFPYDKAKFIELSQKQPYNR